MAFLNKWRQKKIQERLEKVENKTSEDVKVEAKLSKEKLDKKVENKTKTVKKTVKKTKSQIAYKVLISSVVSEKAAVAETSGTYTFRVAINATKGQIKNAVSHVYNVKPKKVRVINMDGKRLHFGKNKGRRKDWKKAIVTLSKGQTIDIHEGV